MARYAWAAPPAIPPSKPATPLPIPNVPVEMSSTQELVKSKIPPVVALSIQACHTESTKISADDHMSTRSRSEQSERARGRQTQGTKPW